MKKLFIIIFIFMIFEGTKSTATCPAWATNYSIFNFTVNGCVFEAIICWKCPVNMGDVWVSVDYFKKVVDTCNPGLTPQQIADSIYNQVSSAAWLWGLCDGFPPCNPGPVQTFSIIKYNCWYIYNNNNKLEYYVCSFDSWCQRDGVICWDNLLGPIRTFTTGWYHQGPENCPYDYWPPAPAVPGTTSVCGTLTNCP